ncbi:MAG: CinA family protein [Pirellulaceae bacterium]|nr:CinA family protein [Pirellulaceae bacterium]
MNTKRTAMILLAILGTGGTGPLSLGAEHASDSSSEAVEYMIVVTGGELLAGAFPDSHTVFLTRTLRPLGLNCVGSICVDDGAQDIHAALKFALARVRMVIVTGGLGPTQNDITRETLSDFTGIPLEENEEVLAAIERRMGTTRDRLRSNLRRQVQTPVRGTYLKNVSGSSVGLVFDLDPRVVIALPGPPSELQPMVRQSLVPWLAERFGTRLPGAALTIRFVGVGQSQIDQTMQEHIPLDSDIIVQSQFEASRVDFTFLLPDDTPASRARLDALREQIQQHLGEYIYGIGDTTLESHILQRLADRHQTLAVAEAGSGGCLASALAGTDGADTVLAGAVIACDDARLGRLVEAEANRLREAAGDEARADLLAAGVAGHFHGDWSVAVGQLQRSPDGAPHVAVAIRSPDGQTTMHRVALRGTDPASRSHLTTRLLDLLRKRLP